MALPIILVNSATGSDTDASGAGPATALTGSAGVTAADGLSVVLDGSPDLSGVATDGSHVIFMSDTNAGSRNFAKITGTANSGTPTATVTVSDAFQALNTDAWAIGGKRASIGSTTSAKLFSNNATAGDAMPGWLVRMESGHAETITAELRWRRAGDATSGPIILEGVSGAATLPILTFSNNGSMLNLNSVGGLCRDFELRNSNATKTSSTALLLTGSSAKRIKINHATNFPWKGITLASNCSCSDCIVASCASNGMEVSSSSTAFSNYIHHNGGHGILVSSTRTTVLGNVSYANTGDGCNISAAFDGVRIVGNTFDANGGDGIEFSSATTSSSNLLIANNIISNNTGYGINFSNGAQTDAALYFEANVIHGNNIYNNTGGATNPATITTMEGTTTGNPTFTNAATFDHSIGTVSKAKGHPVGGTQYVGTYSTTYSYIDPGAAQRQEAGGTSGGYVIGS